MDQIDIQDIESLPTMQPPPGVKSGDVTMTDVHQASNNPTFIDNEYNLEEQIEYGHQNGTHNYIIEYNPIEEKIPKNNPKLIKENFGRKVTNLKNIQELIHTNNGKILAITSNKKTAQELTAVKSIIAKKVNTSIQTECNTIRFTLHIPTYVTLTELKEELEAENALKIHNLRRFTKKLYNTQVPSEIVLVTIFGRIIPDHIKIWLSRQKVKIFIDRPRQCSKCLLFNHPTKYCKSTQKCDRCSEEHINNQCKNEIKCSNCKNNHIASSQECPAYKKEEELLKFKALNGLTYGEARRRLRESAKKTTYANITNQNIQTKTSEELIKNNYEKDESYLERMVSEMKKNLETQFLAMFNELKIQMTNFVQEGIANLKNQIIINQDIVNEPHASKKFKHETKSNKGSTQQSDMASTTHNQSSERPNLQLEKTNMTHNQSSERPNLQLEKANMTHSQLFDHHLATLPGKSSKKTSQ